MKNRNVGYLIVGIAVVLALLVLLFNNAMTNIVSTSCSHGPSCTMYGTIRTQTYIAIAIVGVILIIGLFLIFAKEHERIVVRKEKLKKKELNLEGLDKTERKVIEMLIKENGAMFQPSLMEKLEIGKVKATRMLDKLEAKQLIERKRRGMNNIVVLKD